MRSISDHMSSQHNQLFAQRQRCRLLSCLPFVFIIPCVMHSIYRLFCFLRRIGEFAHDTVHTHTHTHKQATISPLLFHIRHTQMKQRVVSSVQKRRQWVDDLLLFLFGILRKPSFIWLYILSRSWCCCFYFCICMHLLFVSLFFFSSLIRAYNSLCCF